MIGRKYSTERHIASTNTQVADLSSARKSIIPTASSTEAIAMISEAPSSTPMRGRKESERYSKKLSSQDHFPRALERIAALTSASVCGRGLPPAAIEGRAMIWEWTPATAPPMTTWKRSPDCGTVPMTSGRASSASRSTFAPSCSWKRSRVAQWVRLSMFSGPPTPRRMSSAVWAVVPGEELLMRRPRPLSWSGPGSASGADLRAGNKKDPGPCRVRHGARHGPRSCSPAGTGDDNPVNAEVRRGP